MEINQSEKIIKDFLTAIANQDNRCTAAPYFYVIMSKVEVPAYEGCGDGIRYFDPEDPEDQYDSLEEYIASQKEYANYDELDELDQEEFDGRMDSAEYDLSNYEYQYDWVERGMFLTETDAKEHLRRNHYHYSPDAHTYVKHSWRAPELEKFFKALYSHFEVEKGNLDL